MATLDEKAAALAEGFLFGFKAAADRNGVSYRSLARWRASLEGDPELAALVSHKKKRLETAWGDDAVRALGRMIRKLEELVQDAGPDKIREVAGAIKIVGELEVVRGMLSSGDQPGTSESRKPAAQPAPGNGASRGNGASKPAALH